MKFITRITPNTRTLTVYIDQGCVPVVGKDPVALLVPDSPCTEPCQPAPVSYPLTFLDFDAKAGSTRFIVPASPVGRYRLHVSLCGGAIDAGPVEVGGAPMAHAEADSSNPSCTTIGGCATRCEQ